MISRSNILGIDVGSVAVSVVVLNSSKSILQNAYDFHHGNTAEKLRELLNRFDLSSVGGIACTASTPSIVEQAVRFDNQVAVLAAARHWHPGAGSILVVGGEKFGLIRLDDRGNYLGFKSNTGCAAGTGSFLDQQARRLNLGGPAELSRLACDNKGAVPKIASRCAVFAKTDLVHAQQEGYSLPEICDGLCQGLARNIVDTLFNGNNVRAPVLFTGGVSQNRAVVNHLQALIGKQIVTGETYLYPAAGAALSLLQDQGESNACRINSADDILVPEKFHLDYVHGPLELTLSEYPDFSCVESYEFVPDRPKTLSAIEVEIYENLDEQTVINCYLGIDVGSTSTKAVLIGPAGVILAGFYTRTAGNPLTAVQSLLAAVNDMARRRSVELDIAGAATTGAGRKFIGKIIGADMVIDEITAHARAAVEIDPRVDTIIEIGGQDSKFTTLKNGSVTSAVMNNVCAAGTGSFIEEQAQKLGCSLSFYSERAAGRQSPLASDRCTVFMERDLNHYLNEGYPVDNLLAAVLHSVCENYLAKVADEKSIGEVVFFQGATARNRALAAAFEKRLGKPIRVSRYCHLTGALGAALMRSDQGLAATFFRGLHLHKKEIPLRSEICDLCSNHCKLTVADIDGSKVAYGFLCGRDYDTQQFVNNNRSGFDLLKTRSRIYSAGNPKKIKEDFVIGLPAALHLLEDLPFWQHFYNGLGIKTVDSSRCRTALKDGKRLAGAEFCAPMTVLHGHVSYLMKRCDFIFLPFYLDLKGRDKGPRRQYCYYTQFAPGLSTLIDGADRNKFLMPVVHYLYSSFHAKAQLYRMLKGITASGISYFDVSAAYDRAREFMDGCLSKWKVAYQEQTDGADNLHAVLLGRPYTVLTAAMHKGIPNILAALGTKTFFQDMLEYSADDVAAIEPLLNELHWHYAAKILEAAEVVARSPGAYPILMTAFKCAPDSFVIDYFKQIMESHAKPYLILQLDEHDSTGGYETRIEAALGAFQNHFSAINSSEVKSDQTALLPSKARDLADKTLIIPNWDPISSPLIAESLKRVGFNADCLEETPNRILRSMRYNSGQCIPLNIIAQEFIDYIEDHGLVPSQTVLWFPEGEIACNLKLYPHHFKYILESYGNGMETAQVYAGPMSMIDISMTLPVHIYFAYMFGGMVRKMGCKIRPYERHKGETDRVIEKAVDILADAFAGNCSREEAVEAIVSLFEQIETVESPGGLSRPKVAIFGDLYARDNHVFNQDLIHFIEDNGGEVLTTPYSDYLKMVSRPYLRKWLIEGHYLSVLSSQALMTTLKLKEKTYYKYFERILDNLELEFNDSAREILAQYNICRENTGESMDNILKIHYIKKHHPDVALFVQTSPAFCCPSLVTEAMAGRIEQVTGTPIVSITYDGTGGSKNDVIIPYLRYPGRDKVEGSPSWRDGLTKFSQDRSAR